MGLRVPSEPSEARRARHNHPERGTAPAGTAPASQATVPVSTHCAPDSCQHQLHLEPSLSRQASLKPRDSSSVSVVPPQGPLHLGGAIVPLNKPNENPRTTAEQRTSWSTSLSALLERHACMPHMLHNSDHATGNFVSEKRISITTTLVNS